jgi:hypothetical protein
MNFHRNLYPINNKKIVINNYYNSTNFKIPANAVNYIHANNLPKLSIVGIFPSVTIISPLFDLKPEYKTYIALYGIPQDGLFDVSKLANIIAKQT